VTGEVVVVVVVVVAGLGARIDDIDAAADDDADVVGREVRVVRRRRINRVRRGKGRGRLDFVLLPSVPVPVPVPVPSPEKGGGGILIARKPTTARNVR